MANANAGTLYHEAAHAVIGARVGHRCDAIRAGHDRPEYRGAVMFTWDKPTHLESRMPATARDEMFKRIKFLVAGRMASSLLNGEVDEVGSADDYNEARYLASGVLWDNDEPPSGESIEALLKVAEHKVATELNRPDTWKIVVDLVSRLRDQPLLFGNDVIEFFRAHDMIVSGLSTEVSAGAENMISRSTDGDLYSNRLHLHRLSRVEAEGSRDGSWPSSKADGYPARRTHLAVDAMLRGKAEWLGLWVFLAPSLRSSRRATRGRCG